MESSCATVKPDTSYFLALSPFHGRVRNIVNLSRALSIGEDLPHNFPRTETELNDIDTQQPPRGSVSIPMNSFRLQTLAIYFCHPFCSLIILPSLLQFFSPSLVHLLAFFTHTFFSHVLSLNRDVILRPFTATGCNASCPYSGEVRFELRP
jgi:hypothetical protein